jgi:hypothetical protein
MWNCVLNRVLAEPEFLEQCWEQDIAHQRFIPHITAHEFETLLFVDTSKFCEWTGEREINGSAQTLSTKAGLARAPETSHLRKSSKITPHSHQPETRHAKQQPTTR